MGEKFTSYLKEKIYKLFEEEFKDKIKLKKSQYKIVMIEYDSNQSEMIKLLKKRGKLIAGMKEEAEIKKVEDEITVLKREFPRPKSAFITFNHTKALNLINSINRKKKIFKCCVKEEKKMQIREAEIANNIKWEMRHQALCHKFFRRISNFFFISLVLLLVRDKTWLNNFAYRSV